jgi:hypothetical protein
MSEDGSYANCTRPEPAGQLELTDGSEAYGHRMQGPCACGIEHQPQPINGSSPQPQRRIVGTADFTDEDGNLLFQEVRHSPKGFQQRAPDGKGGWRWSIKGVRRVLFNLPALVAADPNETVWLSEGTKDVSRLAKEGLVATCNPMGAGSWISEYNESLKGRHVVILGDNDAPGRKHVRQVASSLLGTAVSIKVLEFPDLPEGGDVSDWLDVGHTIEELCELAESAPAWEPEPERAPGVHTNGSTPSLDAPDVPLLLPMDVWRPTFDDYRQALNGVTEAADEHHFAALATSIGAVLGRRVYVDYAYRLYPNLFTLIVGPAGSSKKTTALRLARQVVTRADDGLSTQNSVGSGEGLLEALAEADSALGPTPMHRRLLLTQSEMGQLLAKARQDGSGTLVPMLLDAFDCPSMLNPKTRSKPITAYKPTLSIMAATTPRVQALHLHRGTEGPHSQAQQDGA